MRYQRLTILTLALSVAASACAAGAESAAETSESTTPAAAAATPTGNVITIEMITDGAGNYFKPAEVTARRGDVLRYVLTSGVHNVHFVADSNPPGAKLPPASALLQLPGQTVDVVVEFVAGRYYFHCDPHALLGMVGHVTVSED